MTRREWTVCLAAALAVASLVFTGTIRVLPRLIEARALARFGAPNTMHFAERPDASTRRVVRPSPDLLYAVCPFDLANGPLRLTANVPHSTYWSVSAFDAVTNNFFVRDDRQIAGDSIEIIAIRRGMALPPLGNTPDRVVLFAPTERGLFLIRLLINDETQLTALDAIRRQASCEIVVSPPDSG
ncbi:MAG: DUF1254 domain-containing protein [Acetobacteraceae bacterium]|jgi:uncharacterized membrane protein